MSKKEERRSILTAEFRAENAETRTVYGYAAVFNIETELAPGFVESIAPGAFSSSVNEDVRALWNHDLSQVLGRTKSGSLRLTEDSIGLRFELDLPDTSMGRDAFELIKRKDVTGVSFGFFIRAEEWIKGDDKTPNKRIIKDVELFEISLCPFPAYESTSVSARSAEAVKEKIAEWEAENKKDIIDNFLENLRQRSAQLEIISKQNQLLKIDS
jgi:HK97 family phage prohead protease